jgi:hypothetical protein
MSSSLPHGTVHRQRIVIALSLIAALSACAAGQDASPPAKSAPKANDKNATVAKGETVSTGSEAPGPPQAEQADSRCQPDHDAEAPA